MSSQPVYIAGSWRPARASGTFPSENPATGEPLPEIYPVSNWEDCEEALDAAAKAFEALRQVAPEQIATFLEALADAIEARREALVEMAHAETALPASPRLADVELPRTTGQLRQAAAAAREGSWAQPTIDTATGIRSCYGPLGPVAVFGPNNFPFAFNSAAGGDFAAALAAGNPVLAKANSSHPGTTRLLVEAAAEAIGKTGMPPATVQLLYRTSHEDGERLVSDPRLGATGYTGSRSAGLKLKAAADAAGKPIYLELSSVNPVIILPGALREREEAIVTDFCSSCLMGTGQFCTNPGLVVLLAGEESEKFVRDVADSFGSTEPGVLLSGGVARSLVESVETLERAGAERLLGGKAVEGPAHRVANALLRVSGAKFLADPEVFQTEMFGNASLLVVADSAAEVAAIMDRLEGNLTGCVYSDTAGADDADYDRIVPHLRQRVGRLLNDKMPTGVAVSPAMNHGGPYPATSHPGFSAVGIPGSLLRFAMLQCYDNVRPGRLPALLRDENPAGAWRRVDGTWTRDGLGAGAA